MNSTSTAPLIPATAPPATKAVIRRAVTFLPRAAAVFAPAYKDVVAFVILVLVLLIRPQGILSEIAVQKEVVA